MIKEYLELKFKQNKLISSWLINAKHPELALKDLHQFLLNNIFPEGKLEDHPDYHLIGYKGSALGKEITIEQIRELLQFFYKTPSISKYRVASIYQAHLMNLNAANACLKLLEEPPKHGFIFLITTKGSSLLPTIQSRCAKINVTIDNSQDLEIYKNFTNHLANYLSSQNNLFFVTEFDDKEIWKNFFYNSLYLINKIVKKTLNINVDLSEDEVQFYNKIKNNSLDLLLEKFNTIKKIIHDTTLYELNLKASTLILINELIK